MRCQQQELTNKQKVFCKAYIRNGYNGAQAAIVAGYSKETAKEMACENLTKPHVKKYVDELMTIEEERLGLSKEWAADMLKKTAEGCITGKASQHEIHPAGVIGAVEAISKLFGYNEPEKKEIKHDVTEMVKEYEREY
ncbi:MAG TPA: terminase small subunit [Candidatus Sulfotelmatobacter sp.]|jgi:phage terminase small subunit|nr:terminase small subunit [Candidatus Sulfotelmatobacter sp.]